MAKHLYCDGRAIRDPEHVEFLSNYKLDLYKTHQNIDQTLDLEQVANNWLQNYVSLGTNFKDQNFLYWQKPIHLCFI